MRRIQPLAPLCNKLLALIHQAQSLTRNGYRRGLITLLYSDDDQMHGKKVERAPREMKT
jgi:hypothetical protein